MFINIFLYCGVPQDSVLETILLSFFNAPFASIVFNYVVFILIQIIFSCALEWGLLLKSLKKLIICN